MNRFVKELALYGQADSPPKMLGDRDLNVLLTPLPRNKRAPNPRQADVPKHEAPKPPDASAAPPP
jgi:hypothetical protein